jgi:hypothetical protein
MIGDLYMSSLDEFLGKLNKKLGETERTINSLKRESVVEAMGKIGGKWFYTSHNGQKLEHGILCQ